MAPGEVAPAASDAAPAATPAPVTPVTVSAVLFDFGNTLFAHEPLARTLAAEASRFGVQLSSAQAAALCGDIDAAAMAPGEAAHPRDLDPGVWAARWRLHYGLADRVAAGLGEALYASMHDPAQWRPYAATAEVLAALAGAGVRVGVVSNTGWDVRAVFEHHGLHGAIGCFVLSYEVGMVKPQPGMFLRACAALGVAPAEALMVGDDARADAGALAAGLRTLLLPPAPPGADNGLRAALAIAGRG